MAHVSHKAAQGSSSVAQAVAIGTQNFAALAGLFATDTVEGNALAMHMGYGAALISSFSMLGILGLVKSTLKIVLGLERCRAAGFNLAPVRGIFGYAPKEVPATGELVDCDLITVNFSGDMITIFKTNRPLDNRTTPMVTVGSSWPDGGLYNKTAVNLGNLKREAALSQSLWVSVSAGMLCSGPTAWLLLIIDSPWTWIRIFATAGLHFCLIIILAIPLWFERQTGRPGAHLTPAGWSRLWDLDGRTPPDNSSSPSVTSLQARWDQLWSNFRCTSNPSTRIHLLQASLSDGNVLHFQGDISFLNSRRLKALALILSAGTAATYICQYAIVSTASNKQSIIWVTCQAVTAFLRLMYWIINPSFDDPQTDKAEFVLVNNRQDDFILLPELLCACDPGETKLPLWVWNYLKITSMENLLRTAASRTQDDVVPDAPGDLCNLLNVDFNRIVASRQLHNGYYNTQDQNHRGHRWRLAFWKSSSHGPTIRPLVLVEVPFVKSDMGERECWMEAVQGRVNSEDPYGAEGKLRDTCTNFAVTDKGRLHLRSVQTPERCDQNCNKLYSGDLEHSDSFKYLFDRSQMCRWILELFTRADGNGLTRSHGNTWNDAVWVSLTPGAIDRHGKKLEGPRQRIFGRQGLVEGLGKVRDYISGGYNPHTEAQVPTQV